ncbi:MAG TPA: glycine--tRNA ligase subunit beta, partial [Gallionella sp.]|nr:glycine--tRNA ligase subunit beta [Gallionella sp.]
PKSLKKLGESFAEGMHKGLSERGFVSDSAKLIGFATPRRLGVWIPDVMSKAPDKSESEEIMPTAIAFDAEQKPTPPLIKRLQKMFHEDVDVTSILASGDFVKKTKGGKEYLYRDRIVPGGQLFAGLEGALEDALGGLPIAKLMTYPNPSGNGWKTVNFVRPVHGIVALHGADILPISALGLIAGRETRGHRFESQNARMEIRDADSYEAQIEYEGAVIPGFDKRRAAIARQLAAAASKEGLQPIDDETLLDEVTALVERPDVLVGMFEKKFLDVPQECLILTMKANQKYFPLLDANGKLTNKFLIVSNIRPADASLVVGGNERVVRPRLADAKFFYDKDRKQTLESRVEKLANVVYHNKLGTQLQRVERIATLSGTIARMLGADKADAELAARLCKADLLTDMVGEFPELQGIMGSYYALHDGEDKVVADAIESHYHPRFAGDTLPQGAIACSVALSDKLETLVGIYGIGQVPTGDKDPFGLRRHALGILRILIETPIDLPLDALLKSAAGNFPAGILGASVASDVETFMLDRLRGYLRERDFEVPHIEAVLYTLDGRLHQVLPRLEGVRTFAALEVAKDLAAANKRVQNIMRKNREEIGTELEGAALKPGLLNEAAEQDLYQAMLDITPFAQGYLDRGEYGKNLKALVTLKPFIDDFFEKVMVMCEDKRLRLNRALLLQQLGRLMNQVADISKLAA